MLRRDKDGAIVCISCDDCRVDAPKRTAIQKAGGLIKMGWHCLGGSHVCPKCIGDKKP